MANRRKLHHMVLGAAISCACVVVFEVFVGKLLPLYVAAGFERAIRTPAIFALLPYAIVSPTYIGSATIYYTALTLWGLVGGLIASMVSGNTREAEPTDQPVNSRFPRPLKLVGSVALWLGLPVVLLATIGAFVLDWSTGLCMVGGGLGRPGVESLGGPTLGTISYYSGVRFPASTRLRESSIAAWQSSEITATLSVDRSDVRALQAATPTSGVWSFDYRPDGPNRVVVELLWHTD